MNESNSTHPKRRLSRVAIVCILGSVLILMIFGGIVATVIIATKDYGHIVEAAKEGDLFAVQCFLLRGAGANAKDKDGEMSLHWAAGRGHTEVAGLLIARGADVNAKQKGGTTPLHGASTAKAVGLLIAEGADVDAKDEDEFTPLHWTARVGKAEVAELLIAKGADVNAKPKGGGGVREHSFGRFSPCFYLP